MASGRRTSILESFSRTAVGTDVPPEKQTIQPAPAPGRPDAVWVPLDRCIPSPRNPREDLGSVDDLAGIAERQLQSCLAITRAAYLRLWPEDTEVSSADAATLVIINGNRRLTAARQFGRSDLLVVTDDSIATRPSSVLRAAHDENTARRDLNPIEEARSVLSIVATYPNAKSAAAAEGWSAPWITHKKNMLKIHPTLQAEVVSRAQGGEGLTIRLARQLGALPGVEGMSLEQQRDELARLANPAPPVTSPPPPAPKGKTLEEVPPQPAPQAEWRMPEDAVARFSEAIQSAARRTGSSPDAVMWETLAKLSA